MDIFIFSIFVFIALFSIFIDFYKEVPYMGVLGGIILILLGVFVSVNVTFTQSFCEFNSVNVTIDCVDHPLPFSSFASNFGIGVGGILMLVGVGVILDTYLRGKDKRRRDFFGGVEL